MWSKEEGWRQSLRAYLKSGGYQKVVNRESIRQLPQRTLVLWGEEDDVLPVEDAYKYDAPMRPLGSHGTDRRVRAQVPGGPAQLRWRRYDP